MAFTTKSDYIYDELLSNIVQGRFNNGERIVTTDIAKKYGVSAIPVREALQRLSQDGYVTIEPHVGARVVQLDYEHMWEIIMLRIQIEPLTAKLAVQNISKTDVSVLEEYLKKMGVCIEENNSQEYDKLNNEFHSFIYDRCRYKTIRDLTGNLKRQSALSRVSIFDGTINKESYQDHMEWVDAIKCNEEDRVYDIVKRHQERALEYFSKQYGTEKK